MFLQPYMHENEFIKKIEKMLPLTNENKEIHGFRPEPYFAQIVLETEKRICLKKTHMVPHVFG